MNVLAHEKWFVDDRGLFAPEWERLLDPLTLTLIASAVALAIGWRVAARQAPKPELGVLGFLGRLAPWIPRLLGVHLGVSLLGLAVENAYLAPHLSLEGVPGAGAIAIAEGALGVWLISGVALRPAAAGVVLLGPLGLVLAGPVAVLEAVDLLGIGLFLLLMPPGADRWGAVEPAPEALVRPLWALKVCGGLALTVLAFSEKLLNLDLAVETLERYPVLDVFSLLGLDLGSEAFVLFAAAVELLFGLLVISGAAPQVAVLVAGVPFNATLWFFGTTELIGHLPVYGIMLALLVYGSDPRYALVVPRSTPTPGRSPDRLATAQAG